MSENLDRAVLLDYDLFSGWIEDRLRAAVQLAIENQTLTEAAA